jgi:prepilin signal peptidase PulO-like enzyme (type II secretory pathway)
VYTPEGYIKDPPDAVCPHCGKKGKPCSYVNSLSRAWARSTCAKKNPKVS